MKACGECQALLGELLLEVRQLRRVVEGHARGPEVPHEALLSALASALGGAPFTARRALRHPAVRAAAQAALIDSASQLGKALQHLAARAGPGLRVVRASDSRDGAVWQVRTE